MRSCAIPDFLCCRKRSYLPGWCGVDEVHEQARLVQLAPDLKTREQHASHTRNKIEEKLMPTRTPRNQFPGRQLFALLTRRFHRGELLLNTTEHRQQNRMACPKVIKTIPNVVVPVIVSTQPRYRQSSLHKIQAKSQRQERLTKKRCPTQREKKQKEIHQPQAPIFREEIK